MPAPWAKLVFPGSGCTWASLQIDISAYAPLTVPPTYTRSPGFTLVTPAPTASTTPPVSPPGVYGSFGPRLSVLDLRYVSTGFTPTACLRTSTCPCPGCGAGISSSFSTFGPPYSDTRIAFIAVRSSLRCVHRPVMTAVSREVDVTAETFRSRSFDEGAEAQLVRQPVIFAGSRRRYRGAADRVRAGES